MGMVKFWKGDKIGIVLAQRIAGTCDRGIGPRVAEFAKGFISHFGDFCSSVVCCDRCASQMVTEDVRQDSIFTHCDSLTACIVVLGDNPVSGFVIIIDKIRGG